VGEDQTDPRVNAIGAPGDAMLARAARAPLHLFTGEQDALGTVAGMAKLGEVTVLPGLGHSPHVEAPKAFWQAIACALELD
jgi:pimeloyl-ACP methyl ester carboxylesterase